MTGNSAQSSGGGMYLGASSPALFHVTLSGNSATYDGGGMYLSYYSNSNLTQVTLSGNSAEIGGGMYLYASSPTLTHVTLFGNSASVYGGGMYVFYSSPNLTQVTLTGNSAEGYGGGIYISSVSSPQLVNSLVGYNSGSYNVYQSSSDPGTPSIRYSAIYDPDGDNTHGLTLDTTNLTMEPGFLVDPVWDANGGLWVFTDLHLAIDSPLIDLGDPSILDPDDSRSDLGIYGGPGAEDWDRDGDGFYDYFWPGTIEDAPAGFDPEDFDADDWDAEVY